MQVSNFIFWTLFLIVVTLIIEFINIFDVFSTIPFMLVIMAIGVYFAWTIKRDYDDSYDNELINA